MTVKELFDNKQDVRPYIVRVVHEYPIMWMDKKGADLPEDEVDSWLIDIDDEGRIILTVTT